jgi:glycosyltransferase involved in cell wall biosynthesis
MGVTLFTTCFGGYGRFLPGWLDAAAESGADEVLVVSDIVRPVPSDVRLVVSSTDFRFREAGFRNAACRFASQKWLWQIDVDDRIVPDAVQLLAGHDADIVQVGYVRTDGMTYVPDVIPNVEFLASGGNPYVSGSPFRASLFAQVQFPDVAWSDWGFWRLAARAGARFAAAGQVGYVYRWEPHDSVTGVYTDPQHIRDVLCL